MYRRSGQNGAVAGGDAFSIDALENGNLPLNKKDVITEGPPQSDLLLRQKMQPAAFALLAAFVLYWFFGEVRYIIAVLGLCSCGLLFAKYLSE